MRMGLGLVFLVWIYLIHNDGWIDGRGIWGGEVLGLVHSDRTVTRLDIPRWTSGVKVCMRRRDSIEVFIRFTTHKEHKSLL